MKENQHHGEPRSRAEYDAQVAAFNAERWRALTTGQAEAHTTRRLDYNEHTGAYLSRIRRRGGSWSRPRVVAVSRVRRQLGSIAARPRPAARLAPAGGHGVTRRRLSATTGRVQTENQTRSLTRVLGSSALA